MDDIPSPMAARFFIHAQPQADGSVKDKVYINIRAKGHRESHSREMREEDKKVFPNAWKLFEREELVLDGTPLKALPGSSPTLIHELSGIDIHTVEDLANLQESAIANIRMGRALQARAKAYLASLSIEMKEETPDEPVYEEDLRNNPDVITLNVQKKSTRKKTSRKKSK